MPSDAIFYLLSFPRPTALAVVVLVASRVDFPYPAAAVAGLCGRQVSHKSQPWQSGQSLSARCSARNPLAVCNKARS